MQIFDLTNTTNNHHSPTIDIMARRENIAIGLAAAALGLVLAEIIANWTFRMLRRRQHLARVNVSPRLGSRA